MLKHFLFAEGYKNFNHGVAVRLYYVHLYADLFSLQAPTGHIPASSKTHSDASKPKPKPIQIYS
jgi:hypothetical protein